MSEPVQGRRLPDRQVAKWGDLQEGDYVKFYDEDDGPLWFTRPPRGFVGTLRTHTITEHEDGTITVSPSILTPEWHGYLIKGVWQEV